MRQVGRLAERLRTWFGRAAPPPFDELRQMIKDPRPGELATCRSELSAFLSSRIRRHSRMVLGTALIGEGYIQLVRSVREGLLTYDQACQLILTLAAVELAASIPGGLSQIAPSVDQSPRTP